MANVTGTQGKDVIHVNGDGTIVPNGFTDIPLATNDADAIDALGGNDMIVAGGGNDKITGGAGADTIDGGAGIDAARYDASGAAVVLNLGNPSVLGSGGDADGDKLINIENLFGSTFNDILSGSAVGNLLAGMAGNDILSGA